jgi:CubicO group peptidase (beta-lactamase class C family)
VSRTRWVTVCLVALGLLGTGVEVSGFPNLVIYGPGAGSGLAAQLACAGVFVSGRDLEDVRLHDIVVSDPLLAHVALTLDRPGRTVTATLFGLGRKVSLYRPGLGCTLVLDSDIAALDAQAKGYAPLPVETRDAPWPDGDRVAITPNPALEKAVTGAFPNAPEGTNTRAIVVVQDGKIVAERYAPGFGPTMPLLGWSMSKSVTGALIGTLVADGKLGLDQSMFPTSHDSRNAITLLYLLQMRSGLAFDERYAPGDDATTLLFDSSDMAAYAASREIIHQPGQFWAYSTGTANILAHVVFMTTGGTLAAEQAYARDRFFGPAGMTSAVFEPDTSGNFVGGSYLYMTARDWARFGLLYLNEGEIRGLRILPASWVDFSRSPAAITDDRGTYGAQFWLNQGAEGVPPRFPDCPTDMYMALGHNDQVVAIVPSRRAVVVRLGWTTGKASFAGDGHLARILAALKP